MSLHLPVFHRFVPAQAGPKPKLEEPSLPGTPHGPPPVEEDNPFRSGPPAGGRKSLQGPRSSSL